MNITTATDPRSILAPCAVDYFCAAPRCANVVAQGAAGRWFITMGHAGFNLPANNRDGYATRARAAAASATCCMKGGR